MSNLLQEQAIASAVNPVAARLGISNGGKVFWVSSVVGSNTANNGRTGKTPYATLTKALAGCNNSKGDVIFLMEGHAETISAAASIAVNKIGVRIIGIGVGALRPTFTWATGTDATITMTAANCSFENCVFDLSLPSALISGIVISAAGCRIGGLAPDMGNTFLIGTAGTGTRPLQAILTTAAANYLKVLGNQFLEPALTPTTVSAASCAITLVGGTGIQIKGNTFIGWYTTTVGAVACITTLTASVEITNNYIINRTASSAKGVTLLTASSGVVADNFFGLRTGAVPIVGDAVHWGRNWSAAAAATDSTLV